MRTKETAQQILVHWIQFWKTNKKQNKTRWHFK